MGSRRASVSRLMPIQGHDSQPSVGRMRHNRYLLPTSCPRSLGTDPRAPAPSPPYLPHSHSSSATYPAHHPFTRPMHPLSYVTPAHAYCRTSSSQRTSFSLSHLLVFLLPCYVISAIIDNRKEEVINSRRRTIFWLFWFSCCRCSEHDCITSHLVLLSLSYHSNTVSRTPSSYFFASLPTRPPAHPTDVEALLYYNIMWCLSGLFRSCYLLFDV